MQVLRLFPAVQQFQVKNGALNTDGRLYVYLNGTDDLADCFDADGSRIAQPVILDNNGRAPGLFVDSSKVYRLVVQDRYGSLLFTVRNMVPTGGGAGSSLGKTYEVVSADGSILVDRFDEDGTTTFDLSLGIDTDDLKPSCLKASASPLTADGQFVFAEIAHEGTLLSVDNGGKVRMEPAWYHFTATVELAYDGTPVNEGRRVTLWSPLSSSVTDFDTSYAHRESIELSGDIHVDAANTEFPLGVTGLGNGIRASLVGFDIHAVTGHGGNNEYRAGEGITIVNATRTISADFDSVQEKLVAGDNISITGNVISAGNISQEQADWTEDDASSPAYIKNKPDLGVYATRTEVATGLAGKQDVISDLSAIRAGAAAGATALQPSDVATVATSGDYGDLSNRPDLDIYATKTEVNSELASKQDVIPDLSTIRSGAVAGASAVQPADLAAVATSGSYDDLNNRPSIPARTSDLTNDSGFITSADVPVKGVEVDGASVVNAQGVAEITMPDLDGYATTQALDNGLATKQDVISDLSTIRSGAAEGATAVQPGDLATVATSGSYDDLSGKPDLSVYATGAELTAGLATKQDTVSDLATIRSGAALGATAIQPSDLATVATTGSYEDLSGKPAIPAAQVQSDWSESDTSSKAYIQNKPDLSVYATDSELSSGLATKQDTIGDLADIRSGAAAGATAVQPGDLATVATTGDYDDLNGKPDLSIYAESSNLATVATTGSYDDLADKPAIPAAQVNSDWNASSGVAEILNKPTLSTVATTGDYDDLSNKPSIPAAQINSDWSESDTTSKAYIRNKPDLGVYATRTELTDGLATKQDTISDLATIRSGAAEGATAVQPGDLATVATSGSYNDLSGKPTIPAAPVQSDWNEGDSSSLAYIQNKPTLSAVATSGSYNDLTDTPTIPSVPVQDVTVDGSSVVNGNGVAEITMPTALVPDVTSSDNNKTLVSAYADGVGSYAWAQNTFVAQYGTSTYAEIKAAIDAGYNVLCLKTDSAYTDSSFAGGIGYIYRYGRPGGNIEFNYFQPLPNGSQATEENQGIAIVHSWKVDSRNTWKSSQVVVSPKIVASSPLSLSYSNVNREVTLGVSLGSTLTTSNDAIEVAAPIPDVTSSDDGKILKASYTGGVGSYSWEAESSGTVTDVEVDGVSVVSQGVASITLPTVPVTDVTVNGSSVVSNGTAAVIVPEQVQASWTEADTTAVDYIKNKPSLATVATSGSYTDLSDKPSIPTATSDLTNDSGFITLSDVPAQVNADWNSSSGASEILNKPTIPSGTQLVPAATSADADKVLTVNAQGTPEWATGSGSQVQADWAESDSSEPSYIENKPVPKTLTAGTGISIIENQSTITVASSVTVPVRDVTVDGSSVVRNGVAAITTPTVDQTYDASSTNAQSGVAVASGISAAIAASVMPISVVASLPANPDPNTLYVVTGA